MNKETEEKLTIYNGGVTETQIAQWKAQNRKVYEVVVTDDDERFFGYFKRPNQEAMSATTRLAKNDEVKGSMVLFDNCWLGGAPELKDEFLLKLAAVRQLGKLISGIDSELKNL